MDSIFTLVQVTAAYSNAVLVAILPHMTGVAQKLELPFPTPITPSEVRRFVCDPRAGEIGGYVTLTNGYEFWFHHGYVNGVSSPWNVFRLQNPDLLPKFYGPLRMNESEAVALARKTLKKLGYTNDVFDTVKPEVTLESPKESFAVNQGVPQYQVIWHDSGRTNLDIAELDVNAKVKHVDAFQLYSKIFWRTNPYVSVVPKVIHQGHSGPFYAGGRRLTPISAAYSNACMNAVLPIFTDYARKLDLPIQLPITINQCTNIECLLDEGTPSVQIVLKGGCRFNYLHGYVTTYIGPDSYFFGDVNENPTVKEVDLYQRQPVSRDEIVGIARDAIHKLGYSEKELNMAGPPDLVSIPHNYKTKFFTRYEIGWDYEQSAPGFGWHRVTIEVDAHSKSIKAIYLDNTNLWRKPPKIDVPEDFSK